MPEPQSAADYDDRTGRAVKSALVEIGQLLGAFRGKFAVIGGAVPWLLLAAEDMIHVGTIDIDLTLDAEALGDGEYAGLIESLMNHGYSQQPDIRRFQLVRRVPADDGGSPIDVIVDFLMPRHAVVAKNDPPLVDDFAVIRADGADLALLFPQVIPLEAAMPDGSVNRVEISVASIPALLAMKGYAIANRIKQKDAYDIYYCVRNFPGGATALAEECRPLLKIESARQGYRGIAEKFSLLDGFGPVSVRRFVSETHVLGGRTPEQWQTDAYGQVRRWLDALGDLSDPVEP